MPARSAKARRVWRPVLESRENLELQVALLQVQLQYKDAQIATLTLKQSREEKEDDCEEKGREGKEKEAACEQNEGAHEENVDGSEGKVLGCEEKDQIKIAGLSVEDVKAILREGDEKKLSQLEASMTSLSTTADYSDYKRQLRLLGSLVDEEASRREKDQADACHQDDEEREVGALQLPERRQPSLEELTDSISEVSSPAWSVADEIIHEGWLGLRVGPKCLPRYFVLTQSCIRFWDHKVNMDSGDPETGSLDLARIEGFKTDGRTMVIAVEGSRVTTLQAPRIRGELSRWVRRLKSAGIPFEEPTEADRVRKRKQKALKEALVRQDADLVRQVFLEWKTLAFLSVFEDVDSASLSSSESPPCSELVEDSWDFQPL